MITKQHVAITVLSLHVMGHPEKVSEWIPWVVLPDAIRAYIGPRQPSHFEEHPSKKDTSYMVFPSADELKKLTKETAKEIISYHLEEEIPQCVIGEKTDICCFDWRNIKHEYYHTLRMHLLQDIELDKILREKMIDVSERFSDKFIVRHSGEILNGAHLRDQIAKFEELGFLKLAGSVFVNTGIVLDRDWFDEIVYPALKKAYPLDLAENTYKYMSISDDMNERINRLKFGITEEEKASICITNELEEILSELYEEALTKSTAEVIC